MTSRQLKIQTMQQLKKIQRKELGYMEQRLDDLIEAGQIPNQWKLKNDTNLSKFLKHATMISQTNNYKQ